MIVHYITYQDVNDSIIYYERNKIGISK